MYFKNKDAWDACRMVCVCFKKEIAVGYFKWKGYLNANERTKSKMSRMLQFP